MAAPLRRRWVSVDVGLATLPPRTRTLWPPAVDDRGTYVWRGACLRCTPAHARYGTLGVA